MQCLVLLLACCQLLGRACAARPFTSFDRAVTDAEVGISGELEASEALCLLHAKATARKASASLDSAGLPEIQLGGLGKVAEGIALPPSRGPATGSPASAERPSSRALAEAALAAAALAVAEETAAAQAAGGGDDGRLIASTRLADTLQLEEEEEKALQQRLQRFGLGAVHAGPSPPQGGLPPPASKVGLPPAPGGLPLQPQPQVQATVAPSTGGQVHWDHPEGGNPFGHGFDFFNPFTNPYWNPFWNPYASSGGGGHWYSRGIFLFAFGAIVVVTCAGCGVMYLGLLDDDDDDSGEEESDSDSFLARFAAPSKRESDRIAKAIIHGESSRRKTGRWCCGLCWCCSGRVFNFFIVAIICTLAGAYVLWNTGILQPLLAQLLLYAYIIILVMAFVSVLAWEATAALREASALVFSKVQNLDNVFPFFGGRDKRKLPRLG